MIIFFSSDRLSIQFFLMDLLEEVGGATGRSRRLLLDELHRRRDLNNPHCSSYNLHQFTSFLKALCLYCETTRGEEPQEHKASETLET